jgi:hypothetical protein
MLQPDLCWCRLSRQRGPGGTKNHALPDLASVRAAEIRNNLFSSELAPFGELKEICLRLGVGSAYLSYRLVDVIALCLSNL